MVLQLLVDCRELDAGKDKISTALRVKQDNERRRIDPIYLLEGTMPVPP